METSKKELLDPFQCSPCHNISTLFKKERNAIGKTKNVYALCSRRSVNWVYNILQNSNLKEHPSPNREDNHSNEIYRPINKRSMGDYLLNVFAPYTNSCFYNKGVTFKHLWAEPNITIS